TDDGKLAVSIGSQGSFRLNATEGPARQTGSLGTISDGEGEQFFGPDLNFFALTTSGPRLLDSDPDVDIGSASFEPYASSSTAGEVYSYAHLVNQTAADAPTGSRSARVLTGYAAVLGETRLSGDRFEAPYVLTSHDPGGVVVAMEPTTNSLAAVFQLDQNFVSSGSSNGPNYVSDVDTATFGFGGVGEHVGTYIDDDRYAARNTRNPDLYGNINGRQGLSSERDPDGFRSIMVAHELIPMGDFPGNDVTLSECSCFEWGWWASEFRWADEDGPNRGRRERFHMGTFVAGDIAAHDDVQAIIQQGQVATYGGHIVGNVYNEGAQYIAAGNFSHTVDFGSRSGTVGATFDNRSYSGTSFFKDNVSGFEGSLTSNDAGPATRALFDGS